ncbi:MAG: hypothetical protein WBN66_04665 [Smithella sp.]
MRKSVKEWNVEDAIKDAKIKGTIKIATRKTQCTFCNETKTCVKWCPKPLPWILPVCESCFVKLHKTFGKTGAIVWE